MTNKLNSNYDSTNFTDTVRMLYQGEIKMTNNLNSNYDSTNSNDTVTTN